MEDWMRLPLSQLKRLVKSRAGRVAELQMEIKILEGIMERKVREGDLGGPSPAPASKREKPEQPKNPVQPAPQEPRGQDAPREAPEGNPGSNNPPEDKPVQSKITGKSSEHAFREIE